ncbi:MAG: fluoride efflux transporter CrcB [Actinobacteria bacterium]|nr:fluoride efflux transporter CrcB [Actinomycetota bacterium]MSZ41591.1 fluoride efflux transporter CrcB [Actinomycetota bacterium]
MTSRFPLRVLTVIAVGGIVGALARVALAEVLGTGSYQQLTATLTVNVVGALAIGSAFPWVRERTSNPLLQPFLITGVLGGFTTFSTFAADVVLTEVSMGATLIYIAATLFAGLVAVPVGAWLYRSVRTG